MNRRIVRIAVLLLAMAAVAVWVRSYTRDEAKLKRALMELVEVAAKSGPESPVAAAGRAERIISHFSETPEIEITGVENPSAVSRRELRSLIYGFRENLERLEIHIDDISTTVATDRATATQIFTARVTVVGSAMEDSGIRETHIAGTREDDGWKIRRIEATEGFRRI